MRPPGRIFAAVTNLFASTTIHSLHAPSADLLARSSASSPKILASHSAAPAPRPNGKCVVYWMQRAQRGIDNPALDLAIEVANRTQPPVIVYFSAISNFPHANLRHYDFLNQGLPDIEADLAERNMLSSCVAPPHESLEHCSPKWTPRWSSATKTPARTRTLAQGPRLSLPRIPSGPSTPMLSSPRSSSTKRSTARCIIRPRSTPAPEYLRPPAKPARPRDVEAPRNFQPTRSTPISPRAGKTSTAASSPSTHGPEAPTPRSSA